MFGAYVFKKSSAQYTDKILLLDDDDLNSRTNYISSFSAQGFEIVMYTDDLSFRIEHEEKLQIPNQKLAVVARTGQYIPYDILRRLSVNLITFEDLFPRLHPQILKNLDKTELDLLCIAYAANFDDLRQKHETETFLRNKVYSRTNVDVYLKKQLTALLLEQKNASITTDGSRSPRKRHIWM